MYRIICIDVKTRRRSFVNGIFTKQECLDFISIHYTPGWGFVFSVVPIQS